MKTRMLIAAMLVGLLGVLANAANITAWKCGSQYVTSQGTRHDSYGIKWTRSLNFVVFNADSDVKTGRLFLRVKDFTLFLDGKRCKELSREEWDKIYEAKIGPEPE